MSTLQEHYGRQARAGIYLAGPMWTKRQTSRARRFQLG